MNTRDIVFTRDDGSEVLVTLWTDGIATMAERQDAGDIWSPPINARIDNGGVVPLKRPQMPGAAIGSTGPHCPWCARTDAHAHPVNTDIDFVWTPSDGERE